MIGPESILTKRKRIEDEGIKPKLSFDKKIIGNVSKKIKNDNPDEYEYEEMGSPIVDEVIQFSPPPSPPQLRFGPEPLVTYTPIIYATHSLSSNFAPNDEYTDYFNNFLEDGNIECNDDTQIQVLLDELVKMFKMPEINKKVVACKFCRTPDKPFKIRNKLGNYKNKIRSFSSDGQRKNYFYIFVVLEDIPIPNAYAYASASANSNSDSNTDYNPDENNEPNYNTNSDPHDGGSRKRRKSGKKKTTKRRRKTIKRRKTGKKRKTNKRR